MVKNVTPHSTKSPPQRLHVSGCEAATETAVAGDMIDASHNKYRGLFEATPISLWEEDFSVVKQFIEQLRHDGVTEFRDYFDNHPEAVYHCIECIKVVNVNQATLRLYEAENKKELLDNLETIFGPSAFNIFKEELIVISEGGTIFESEGTNYTLSGDELKVHVRWSVAPGYEETLSQIIVSIIDVSEQREVEKQLQLQSTALKSAANAIVITDNKGTIQWANQAFTKLTGYDVDEVIGQNPRILKSGKNNPTFYQNLWRTIQSGNVWYGEEIINKRKDGTLYVEKMTITPVKDENGSISSFIAIKEDITDRKRMETQLRRQLQEAELLSKVISLTSSAKNLTVALEGICEELAHFLDVPQAAFALLNDQRTESTVVAEYLEPERPSGLGYKIPWINNPTSEYILKHKTPIAISEVQTNPLTAPVRDLMRQRDTVSLLIVPVFIQDEIVGTIGFDDPQPRKFEEDDIAVVQRAASQVSQILQRKQAAQELQTQRDFAHQVMNNMGQGLVVADFDWRIEYCNPAFAELLGMAREELDGKLAHDLIFAKNRKVIAKVRSRWLQGETQSHDVQLKKADGSPVHMQMTAVPRWRNDQVDGAIAVFTDLTKHKQIEKALATARDQALETSRHKSEFLANMSHEIRTPLNAIIGMTSLMLNTSLTPELQDYAETIRGSGDVLLSLINDILDFSKIEAGKLELENQPFDLRDCVEEALDVVVTKAAEKGLEMAYEINTHVPPAIVGDVTRLRQILVNLLNNAIKFTETGEVVLSVSGTQASNTRKNLTHDEYTLQFAIQDTGIGIPEDRRNRLFKSFSQVDASTTRKHGGSGLGLAISKHLVEMMGGTIWVESEVGEGSTFHFTLQTKSGSNRRRIYLRGNQPQLAGKRLLIVDDNQTNRLILTKQARLWGMEPLAAASGPEALTWIHEGRPFDVAILDMQMPEMDGLALGAAIRQHRDEKLLPLVMLSSIGSRDNREEEVHFAAFLTKPVKPLQLFDTLTSLFDDTAVPTKSTPKQHQFDPEMSINHPLRILLAEDNRINQKVALRILERMGYRADLAANGLEVLEALQRQTYDVVLMDIQMPDMDGVEATQQIRDIWPEEQQPHIIAMTAHALTGDREKYIKAGMDDYISKPVRIQELLQALANSQPLGS